MSLDWKSVIGTVAPTIATALGGPLAGVAVKAIATKLGVEATEQAVEDAVLQSNPDTLLKLKEADYEFKKSMKNAEIEIERINKDDRASARDMAVKTSLQPQVILSTIYTVAFAVVLYMVFSGSSLIPVEMREPAMYLLGILSAGQLQIMNFWFGSSKGSQDKTIALANSKPA